MSVPQQLDDLAGTATKIEYLGRASLIADHPGCEFGAITIIVHSTPLRSFQSFQHVHDISDFLTVRYCSGSRCGIGPGICGRMQMNRPRVKFELSVSLALALALAYAYGWVGHWSTEYDLMGRPDHFSDRAG